MSEKKIELHNPSVIEPCNCDQSLALAKENAAIIRTADIIDARNQEQLVEIGQLRKTVSYLEDKYINFKPIQPMPTLADVEELLHKHRENNWLWHPDYVEVLWDGMKRAVSTADSWKERSDEWKNKYQATEVARNDLATLCCVLREENHKMKYPTVEGVTATTEQADRDEPHLDRRPPGTIFRGLGKALGMAEQWQKKYEACDVARKNLSADLCIKESEIMELKEKLHQWEMIAERDQGKPIGAPASQHTYRISRYDDRVRLIDSIAHSGYSVAVLHDTDANTYDLVVSSKVGI